MVEYHVFNVSTKSYIYFPEFQQAYVINDTFKKFLENTNENNIENKKTLLNQFVKQQKKCKTYKIEEMTHRNALFLMVATTCNSHCVYCFADSGTYGKSEEIMNPDTAIKAIKCFIDNIQPEEKNNRNFVNYFGGEPMIAWDTIKTSFKYASKYAASKDINLIFRIVTNGTLFDKERIDFLAENNIGVTISIDGGEDIQTKQRPLNNGKNSFLEITKNLDYLLKNIPDTSARSTYVNYDYPLHKIYSDLINLGFNFVDVVPDILNISKTDIEKVLLQIETVKPFIFNEIVNNHKLRFGTFANKLLRIYGRKVYKSRACGAGLDISAIDPKGKIYLCHRYTSEEDMSIGDIQKGGYSKKWNFTTQEETLDCVKCWNRYLCSSGCYYNNQTIHGDPLYRHEPWCLYSKKMSEVCLSLLDEISSDKLYNILLDAPTQ